MDKFCPLRSNKNSPDERTLHCENVQRILFARRTRGTGVALPLLSTQSKAAVTQGKAQEEIYSLQQSSQGHTLLFLSLALSCMFSRCRCNLLTFLTSSSRYQLQTSSSSTWHTTVPPPLLSYPDHRVTFA